MKYETARILAASRSFLAKAKSGCGANAQGGGGFQQGNTCGAGDGGSAAKPKPSAKKPKGRTKQDSKGRTWVYDDGEGAWSNGDHVIGVAGKNGSKWMIWDGPDKDYYEFKTLKEAMDATRIQEPEAKPADSGPEAQVDAMPRVTRNGNPKASGEFVQNVFKATAKDVDAENAMAQEAKDYGMSMKEYVETFTTNETVSLAMLESPQRIIEPKQLKLFMKNKMSEDDEGKLPLVMQYGDAMIIRDGNHRLNAAKLRGEETAKVRLIYVSEKS